MAGVLPFFQGDGKGWCGEVGEDLRGTVHISNWKRFAENIGKTSVEVAAHPDKNGIYSCAKCNYSSIKQYNFQRHMRTHDPHSRIVCKLCGASYVENHLLKRHLQSAHAVLLGQRRCDFCQIVVEGTDHVCTANIII